MKITTTLSVVIERADGTKTLLTRDSVRRTGDNPQFDRREVIHALADATSAFLSAMHLEGEDPL